MAKGTGRNTSAAGTRDRRRFVDLNEDNPQSIEHYNHGQDVIERTNSTRFVQHYTADNYTEINENLRGVSDEKLVKSNRDAIKGLDKMFESPEATFQQDSRVYRGVGTGDPMYQALKAGKLRAGDVFEDKGFVSTSIDPFAANKFSTPLGVRDFGAKLVLRVRARKGQKGVHVQSKSVMGFEKETLLPRGTKYKVRGVSSGKIGMTNVKFLDVDLV